MRSGGTVAVAVFVVFLFSSFLNGAISDPNAPAVTIRCPVEDLSVGDEIPIVVTITNRYPYLYELDGGASYELMVTDANGKTLPNLRPDLGRGYVGRVARLSSGDSFDKALTLNRWGRITEPGTYLVTGIFEHRLKSPSIRIVVKGRSGAEMGRYIQSLAQELDALPPSDNRRAKLVERLAYTGDKRIVPTMLDVMYKSESSNESPWVSLAFESYLPKNTEIRDTVVATAKSRGLADGMRTVLGQVGCGEKDFAEIIRSSLASTDPNVVLSAVLAAQEHPADEHMPRLIAIALDPNKIGPNRPSWMAPGAIMNHAAGALANNRTDDGVAALKILLANPDSEIQRRVAGAIRYAYTRHPIFPEQVDEAYTATLVRAVGEPDSWERWPDLPVEILRTRTIDGAKAIDALAADPNADVPELHTDAGVRAIRDLLRNPKMADSTRQWIAHIYHQPGRPLRAEDFSSEFRENPEVRKKETLQRLSRRY